jgi:hypothetical protein
VKHDNNPLLDEDAFWRKLPSLDCSLNVVTVSDSLRTERIYLFHPAGEQ